MLQQISGPSWLNPTRDTILDEYGSEPTDDMLAQQWHLRNTGSIPDTNYRIRQVLTPTDALRRLGSFLGSERTVIA